VSGALGWLSPLDRKAMRQLWRTRGQSLAIALVIACGVATFLMSQGVLRSLSDTRTAYYERYGFPDIWAPVVRAPQRLLGRIRALPGVARAEGRIAAGVLIDVPGTSEPISGRAISLPDLRDPALNRLHLRHGRRPAPFRDDEVVIAESFALAHDLAPGARIRATLHGAQRELQVVGVALSPEFVFTIAPGELAPDRKRFGVIWMNESALGAAFMMDGAFNEAVLGLTREANENDLLAALDRLLEPYGSTGAYGRGEHVSDRFLVSELDQMRTTAIVMPTIFLGVAAFLLNIVVSRTIETEREQIGLLKAFGYGNAAVAAHYGKIVMLTVSIGVGLGWYLGFRMGRGLAGLYTENFRFPFLLFRLDADLIAISSLIAVGAAALGVAVAVGRAARLTPAVAMQPPAPPDFSQSAVGSGGDRAWLDQPSRMILRQLLRRPGRALLTMIGIAAAVAILVLPRFQLDAINYMIEVSFEVADRQDLSVTFVEPLAVKTLYEMREMEGVIIAEPFRAVSVRMTKGHRSERQGLVGLRPGTQLSRPVDAQLRPISPPAFGLLLSERLAQELDAEPGDMIALEVLEGRRARLDVPVAGIAETFIGSPAYMEIGALNRALDEGMLVSGAYLKIDLDRRQEIYRALKEMPAVAGVALRRESRAAFQKTMDDNMGPYMGIMTIFSCLIAIGVVYNSARISLAERARELASLRVLGFYRAEVAYILLGELGVLTLLALPIGMGLGYLLCAYLVASFSNELYQIPLVIRPSSYGWAASVVLSASVATGVLVARNLARLDLVSALKTRE